MNREEFKILEDLKQQILASNENLLKKTAEMLLKAEKSLVQQREFYQTEFYRLQNELRVMRSELWRHTFFGGLKYGLIRVKAFFSNRDLYSFKLKKLLVKNAEN